MVFYSLLEKDRERDGSTNRLKKKQTDRQTDRQKDRWTNRQTNKKTDTNGKADKKMGRLTDVKKCVSRQRDRPLPILIVQWLLPIPITAPDHLQVTTN